MDRQTRANRTPNRRVRGLVRLALSVFLVLQLSLPGLSAGFRPALNAPGGQNESAAVDPVSYTEGYSAVLYDNSNGLPTSEANAIAQTGEGFLWIGSYGGLIRYDGNTFERIDSTTGITSVNCLYVDSLDRLWIGTNDNGLFLMEHGEYRHWGEEEGLPSLSVRSVTEDEDGLIYAATTGGLALLDKDLQLRCSDDAALRDDYLCGLMPGADGLIYGITNDGDVFTVLHGELVLFLDWETSRFHGVSCIMPDPRAPGCAYVEAKNGKVYHGRPDNRFADAQSVDIGSLSQVQEFHLIDGQLWVCARNGIGVLDRSGVFHELDSLPMQNSVGHVTTDYEGNLWFTSTRQGVMKVVPNRFTDVLGRYGLAGTVVNSTCESDGRLFVGTDEGLIVLDENGPLSDVPLYSAQTPSGEALGSRNLIKLLEGVRIRSILRDSSGRLWISTWRKYGLLRYEHNAVTAFNTVQGLPSDHVRAVCERENGAMLVACTGGACVIEGDTVTEVFGEEYGITNTEILTVAAGFNGEIIIGTDGGGIFILKDGKTEHIDVDPDNGLRSGAVMRIKRDRTRDIFWIVTGNSLAWMSKDHKVTTLEHFPYSNNFDLYQNSKDETWILSSDGIYSLPTESLLEDTDPRPIHFAISNGLPCIATANSYSELTDDGNLYIAGTPTVAKVNIEAPMDSVSDLKIAVPYVDADGVRLYPDESGGFTVGAGVRKLTIYPYVFNYSLNDPEVTCCLYGFDKEPVTIRRSDLDPIDYTNLPGKTYYFTIQVKDPMGHAEDDKQLSLAITKEKALYEQWWFYVLAGMLAVSGAALGVGAYVRRRIRSLEKKHREEVDKERIATELTMANRIQASMLPHTFPPFPDRKEFDIYASMDPAREVGGDFYDFFLIDEDHLCLVMADVSGKGIPAALFMMISKVILQSCAMLGRSPGEILAKTNEAICSDNQVDMFVTVWLGILEISTGKLTAANAGHEYPALRLADGSFELFKDKHGFVIGGMEGVKYKEYELQLSPGDKIFVYTDGVPEATDAEKQMFGTERMLAALNESPDAAPAQILKNVRGAVDGFVREAEQFDDLTMLCLEYRGPEAAGT